MNCFQGTVVGVGWIEDAAGGSVRELLSNRSRINFNYNQERVNLRVREQLEMGSCSVIGSGLVDAWFGSWTPR